MEQVELPRSCMARLAHARVIIDYHVTPTPPRQQDLLDQLHKKMTKVSKKTLTRQNFFFDMSQNVMTREEVIARNEYLEEWGHRIGND